MLLLLQQRTKLSGQIGKMKRRHGAVVYVPERERQLVAQLTRLSKGEPSAKAIAGIYREIMSSSRAAQGQTPIGLLQASASAVIPASLHSFGCCDQYLSKKTWPELAKGLGSGALSLALLTGHDLATVLKSKRWRDAFIDHLSVVGDFPPALQAKASLAERIFIVTPRDQTPVRMASRMLILIECKSTLNAIKSLLRAMPGFTLHPEPLLLPATTVSLACLTLGKPMDGVRAVERIVAAGKSANVPVSILGIYPGTEDYGG